MILLTDTCRAGNSQPQSHSDPGAGRTAQTYHNIHEHIGLQLARPSPGSWEICDTIHPARHVRGKQDIGPSRPATLLSLAQQSLFNNRFFTLPPKGLFLA